MNTRLSLPRWLTLSLLLGMLAAPLPARAHEARPAYLEIREMAPGRYSVLWRTPVMVVPVLALALFAGLRGAAYGRRALFVLPGAWLLGGVVGMAATSSRGSALTAISCLLLGGLLAADARLSLRATTVLAALVGLFHGYLNGAGMGQPGVGAGPFLAWSLRYLFWSPSPLLWLSGCAGLGLALLWASLIAGSPPAACSW